MSRVCDITDDCATPIVVIKHDLCQINVKVITEYPANCILKRNMSDICQPANVITEYPSEPVQFMVHGNWKGIWGEQPSLVSRNSGESSLLLLSFPSFLFWLFFSF